MLNTKKLCAFIVEGIRDTPFPIKNNVVILRSAPREQFNRNSSKSSIYSNISEIRFSLSPYNIGLLVTNFSYALR